MRISYNIILFIFVSYLLTGCSTDYYGSNDKGIIVMLDRVAFTMDVGSSVKINANVSKETDLKWSSSNKKIAKVDNNGNVTGVSEGTAVIYVKARDGGTDSCKVNVGFVSQNPILPPDWNLYIADGEPHFFDGKIYVYGSRDVLDGKLEDGTVNWCSDRYNVLFTDDLVNWSDAGVSFKLSDIPQTDGTRMWAPDVCYNPVDEKYYLYVCFNGDYPFVVATSTSPTGPFTDAKTLMYDDGTPFKGGIDPAVLIDSDGLGYIYWSGMNCAQFVDGDLTVVKKDSVKHINGTVDPFEGPSIRKIGNKYYFIYIQNNGKITSDNISPTKMAYMIGDSPMGPFKYKGIIISNTDYPNSGNIHGSIEQLNGQWFVFYHRQVSDKILTRVACIEPVTINEDGTINEVPMSSSGIKGTFNLGERIQASSAVDFSRGRNNNSHTSVENSFPIMKLRRVDEDENGLSYIGYRYINLLNANKVIVNASSEVGGCIELRLDNPTGKIISTIDIPVSNNIEITSPIYLNPNERSIIYIVLKSGEVNLNWFEFN